MGVSCEEGRRRFGPAALGLLATLLGAGCLPSAVGGGDDDDAAPPAVRDAEREDVAPVDAGPVDDAAADATEPAGDGAPADMAPPADMGPPPDMAPPDMAPEPPCEDGATRACPGCEAGTQTCDGDRWGRCVGVLERCNDLDDDCDGAIDEDWPELGELCDIGTGACRGEGSWVCGMMGARCDARPGRPSAERCDTVDNDCDGRVDEDFDLGDACTVGVGECARDGMVVCHPDAMASVCDAELIDPIVEFCDGADNDCDGEVDEGFDVGAPCAAGEGLCRNEGAVVCTADGDAACSAEAGDPAAAERCNALDDDCDGLADEGLRVGEACVIGDGGCRVPGRIVCDDAELAVCEALPENAEACDGADNDCDGLVDEDFALGAPCQTGGGVCQAPGQVICAPDGTAGCEPERPPVLGVGAGEDGALRVAAGERVVLEDRPYAFTSLTVANGGTLTVAPYDPATDRGGRLELRVQGRLVVEANGVIDLAGVGFRGGPPNPKQVLVYADQWTNGGGTTGYHGGGPGGGGGGFAAPQVQVGSGGGGGHGAAGAAGSPCGADNRDYAVWDVNAGVPVPIAAPLPVFSSGGAAYGAPEDGAVTRGSGGGSGGNNYDGGAGGIGGQGGHGGGALLIVADEVQIDGAIRLEGGAGAVGAGGSYVGGGGGGAGGSAYIAANRLTVGAAGRITAAGGAGGAGTRGNGGQGGAGWVRFDAGVVQNGGAVQPAPFIGQFDCAAE